MKNEIFFWETRVSLQAFTYLKYLKLVNWGSEILQFKNKLKKVSKSKKKKSNAKKSSEKASETVPPAQSRNDNAVQVQSLDKLKSTTTSIIQNTEVNETELKSIQGDNRAEEVTDELSMPFSLDDFFKKLNEVNQASPIPMQNEEYLVNKYSRPRGLSRGERVVIVSESEALFPQRYK